MKKKTYVGYDLLDEIGNNLVLFLCILVMLLVVISWDGWDLNLISGFIYLIKYM